jgi:hypothetical protein
MIQYIEGRTVQGEAVGSFCFEMISDKRSLDKCLFGDRRGDSAHFFAQIPFELARAVIAVGVFVAVPIPKQRLGWGRILFQELTNRMIREGATLGIIEVDPFIEWCNSEQYYANEIAWRCKFYEELGWHALKNAPGEIEIERPFMYSDLSRITVTVAKLLTFQTIDESAHMMHRAECDRESLENC